MYFAFTTLSTIGLGDFHPVSNTERLVGSFVILIGVAMFSYILGELLFCFELIKCIDKPFGDEEDLDKFFITLQGFNYNKPIKKEIQSEVRAFIKRKWQLDKNNFLLCEKDQSMFEQLPQDVKTTIYSDFMFKTFLFKFRRFFNIRMDF